ncbi:hypothetical protein WAI453_007972 [Rhynchosporium graminicola]
MSDQFSRDNSPSCQPARDFHFEQSPQVNFNESFHDAPLPYQPYQQAASIPEQNKHLADRSNLMATSDNLEQVQTSAFPWTAPPTLPQGSATVGNSDSPTYRPYAGSVNRVVQPGFSSAHNGSHGVARTKNFNYGQMPPPSPYQKQLFAPQAVPSTFPQQSPQAYQQTQSQQSAVVPLITSQQRPQVHRQIQPRPSTTVESTLSQMLQGSSQSQSPADYANSNELKQAATAKKTRGNRLSPVSHVRHNLKIVSTTVYASDTEKRLAALLVGNPMMDIAKVITKLAEFNENLADKIDDRDAAIKQLNAAKTQMSEEHEENIDEAIRQAREEFTRPITPPPKPTKQQDKDLAARDRKIVLMEEFIRDQTRRVEEAEAKRDAYHAQFRQEFDEQIYHQRQQQILADYRQQSSQMSTFIPALGQMPGQELGQNSFSMERPLYTFVEVQAAGDMTGAEGVNHGQYNAARQDYTMNPSPQDQNWSISPPRFDLNTQHQQQTFGAQNIMSGQQATMNQNKGMANLQGYGSDFNPVGGEKMVIHQQELGLHPYAPYQSQPGRQLAGQQSFSNEQLQAARNTNINTMVDPFYTRPGPPAQFVLGNTHTPQRQRQQQNASSFNMQSPSLLPTSSRAPNTTPSSSKRRRSSKESKTESESGEKGNIPFAVHKENVRKQHELMKKQQKILEQEREQREQQDGYKRSF